MAEFKKETIIFCKTPIEDCPFRDEFGIRDCPISTEHPEVPDCFTPESIPQKPNYAGFIHEFELWLSAGKEIAQLHATFEVVETTFKDYKKMYNIPEK
jgi:hypothetical protein